MGIKAHCFIYSYTGVQAPFVEKIVLYPLKFFGFFINNKLTV